MPAAFEPGQVIAVPRRGRILVAAIRELVDDELRVVAEGGGRLEIAPDEVLWTFSWPPVGDTRKEIGHALRQRRLLCEDRVDLVRAWRDEGADTRPLVEWVEASGATADDAGILAFVRSLDGELPYFTAEVGVVRRADATTIDEERERRAIEVREKRIETALFDWFTGPGRGPLPEDSEPWMEDLRQLAIGGAIGAAPRAVHLSRRIGCPEPDDLLERLEDEGYVELHVDPSPHRHGTPVEFPAELAAEKVAAFDTEGREDLTALPTIAIDDAGTFEVDDAISWELGDESDRLWIHIADVAAAIPIGSPLDEEAHRRALSIYQPERTIPMFPPAIVASLSLEEGEVRRAISAVVTLSKEGAVLASSLKRTLVHVDRRTGYDDVDAVGESPAIAEALRNARIAEGAIALDLPDAKPALDDEGNPYLKIRRPHGPVDHLVSEAAVLFNRVVAERLAEAKLPALFRHQEACPSELPAPDDPIRTLVARRMLPPAGVSSTPQRHHGVAADHYLMATSPIRRYVDLVHHRQLAALLAGDPPPYDRAAIDALVVELPAQERAARLVQSERSAYWLARLVEKRTGDVLEGLVSRVLPAGRIGVWVTDFLREFTLRLPRSWPRVSEREPIKVRVEKVRPRRGSVRLSVVD